MEVMIMSQTTREDIKRWWNAGIERQATHFLVVADMFDYSDYPVYVGQFESVEDVISLYRQKEMQKIMEVYSLSGDFESQLKKQLNWDTTIYPTTRTSPIPDTSVPPEKIDDSVSTESVPIENVVTEGELITLYIPYEIATKKLSTGWVETDMNSLIKLKDGGVWKQITIPMSYLYSGMTKINIDIEE
jgi:hypothetical protein